MIEFPHGGTVFAIDAATKTGFAFGRPQDTPEIGTVNLGREHDIPADMFGRAVTWWRERVRRRRPDLLVIEPPIPPGELWKDSSYAATMRLHGIYAIFVGLAKSAGIPVLPAPTSTWRKYFLGDGRMQREKAKLAAVRLCRALNWGDRLTLDDNAADAAGMWAWACAQVEPKLAQRVEPMFLLQRGAR
jgi:hypothetical protein